MKEGRERKGGGVGWGGGWLAPEEAEVGVVLPVKTELQHVRGEGCSAGYAEKTEFKKKTV